MASGVSIRIGKVSVGLPWFVGIDDPHLLIRSLKFGFGARTGNTDRKHYREIGGEINRVSFRNGTKYVQGIGTRLTHISERTTINLGARGHHWVSLALGSFEVEQLTRSQTVTLRLKPNVLEPAIWMAVPPVLVTLTPSEDLRSCLITPIPDIPLGMGRQTVKVRNAQGVGVAYYSLTITDDKPVKIATGPLPVAPGSTPTTSANP